MPRVGPGDDNVTGDRYTMDLGVEPDLGNLLQNLQVANDYLDQAEQRFRNINDVVGNTTQRLAAATRQTQLLAAETQRLQNSYQSIASSTMAMANMSGMPMGGGYGGGYGAPGQMSFSGMQSGGSGNIIQTMPSSIPDENASFMPAQSVTAPQRLPGLRFLQAEQARELFSSGPGGGGLLNRIAPSSGALGGIGRSISALRGGYAAGSWGAARAAVPALPELGIAGSEGGALAGLGGLAAQATPYLAAAAIAKKAYDVWAGAQADSRRMAGITGGEAGLSGMIGNANIPGTFSLNARSRLMGLIHPGVDYGEVQERALGAGYVGGQYGEARDYLFETYKRGLGNTIDQLDLYKEAVDKSGASTQQLVSATDALRTTAQNTNASIATLMQNMQAQVESLTGMGLSGGAAVYQATTGAQAFAQAPMASLNPNLREAGGYSITGAYSQVQAANQWGTSIGGLAPYLYSHPGANVNIAGENAAIGVLTSRLGFRAGMSVQDMNEYISSRGWGAYNSDGTTILGSILQQLQILPANMDGGDYQTILNWIWSTLNEHPQRRAANAAKKAMGGTEISAQGTAGRMGGALVSSMSQGVALSQQSGWMGAAMRASGGIGQGIANVLGVFGAGKEATQSPGESYVENLGLEDEGLRDQLNQTFGAAGANTSPVLEKILADGGSETNSFVKTQDGRMIRLDEWMRTDPKRAMDALAKGRVQIAHADSATMDALGDQTRGIENSQVALSGNLRFNTAQEELTGIGQLIEGQRGNAQSDNIVGIDEHTIVRMATEIGKQVAENS